MKTPKVPFLLLGALVTQLLTWSASAAAQLQGAGATFPAPIYQRWIAEYTKANPDVQINYQGVGSGAGIKQFTQNLVSFGASDAAMTDKEIAAVKQGVVLIPATAGSIVLAYNIPGVDNLKLSRQAYAGIFVGKITKWNDPAITKTNEGVKLRMAVEQLLFLRNISARSVRNLKTRLARVRALPGQPGSPEKGMMV